MSSYFMYFLVNMKFWYFKFLKQFIRGNFFSATLPSKHSCEFCFIRLDLIGATQLMTPITLLNEVRISDINIFKIRVVWKIYLIQGFFINVSRIIFKWTASNLLVRSSFNSGDFSSAVSKLVITDSSHQWHQAVKFYRESLLVCVINIGWTKTLRPKIVQNSWYF